MTERIEEQPVPEVFIEGRKALSAFLRDVESIYIISSKDQRLFLDALSDIDQEDFSHTLDYLWRKFTILIEEEDIKTVCEYPHDLYLSNDLIVRTFYCETISPNDFAINMSLDFNINPHELEVGLGNMLLKANIQIRVPRTIGMLPSISIETNLVNIKNGLESPLDMRELFDELHIYDLSSDLKKKGDNIYRKVRSILTPKDMIILLIPKTFNEYDLRRASQLFVSSNSIFEIIYGDPISFEQREFVRKLRLEGISKAIVARRNFRQPYVEKELPYMYFVSNTKKVLYED